MGGSSGSVKNAKKPAHVSALANAGVDNLRSLHIDPTHLLKFDKL
jgi:hypothetical protein